jgi:hypothetical protein
VYSLPHFFLEVFVLSFLIHYILYLEIQPSEDLCISDLNRTESSPLRLQPTPADPAIMITPLWRQIDGSNLASNANRHGSIQSCEQTKPCRSIRSGQAGARVHHPITGKRQLLLRLARPGHRKRSRFRLLVRACLLSRRTTRFCANTITTATSATVITIATAVTDHCHRQSFLSLPRPSQQITASTNTRDTRHRGRPINPLDNIIFRLRALRNSLKTPRIQVTQATAAEPTTSTVRNFSILRALRNQFQQARTQMTTNSTDTWRFFPGRNSPSKA